MTLEPISSAQRDSIVRQMRRTGKWGGRRAGRMIRFWRKPTERGVKIGWQISLGLHKMVHGDSFSIAAAIEACNSILRPEPKPVPGAVLEGAQKRQEWLPYKD